MRIEEGTGSVPQSGEQRLSGLAVSPGIAIGSAHIVEGGDLPVAENYFPPGETEAERHRFAEAVAVSLKQLRKVKVKAAGLPGSAAEEVGYLLDAHVAMLSNSRLVRGVDERIARTRINAERAVQIEIDDIAESFAAMRDPYLAARIEDIRGHAAGAGLPGVHPPIGPLLAVPVLSGDSAIGELAVANAPGGRSVSATRSEGPDTVPRPWPCLPSA